VDIKGRVGGAGNTCIGEAGRKMIKETSPAASGPVNLDLPASN
jgi:hypothetical protein